MTEAAVTHWLMLRTKPPNKSRVTDKANRNPQRSVSGPAIKANKLPNKVAIRLIRAYSVRGSSSSAIRGSVINPRPTVRPGSVATMLNAAMTTMIQP